MIAKALYTVLLHCFFSSISIGQTFGLKGLIVEKYYKVQRHDLMHTESNRLQAGNVTYRVFLDMEPGYRFQAVFGSEGHPMEFRTTTSFFNQPEYGNNVGNLVYENALNKQATMIDSWISAGAASLVHLGVPRCDDDTLSTIQNEKGTVKSSKRKNDCPIAKYDGLKRVAPEYKMPLVTPLNIDTLLKTLNDTSNHKDGVHFRTDNGSWACIGGSVNEYDGKNRVLIGQFTTDGFFSFILNVQLGLPQGGYQQYVFNNPNPGQVACPFLKFDSRDLK